MNLSPTVESFSKHYGGTKLFETDEEYQQFRTEFGKELHPELEKNREARRKSEEQSFKRRVG